MESAGERLDRLKVAATTPGARCAGPVPGVPPTLAEALGGYELAAGGLRCWRIDTPFDQICMEAGGLGTGWAPSVEVYDARGSLCVEGTTAVVLDIETGGFAGTPVFLVGVVAIGQRPLTVVQLLARDYPEEEAVLRGLAELITAQRTWVTFNGRSFDGPFLQDRATLHRVELPVPEVHFDLLHAARRTWRERLPNCRLGTLEEHILKRRRVGDVPGADVPDLFHHFIRTGNVKPLRPVLAHNRLDLVSATELLFRLGAAPAGPG